MALLQQRLLAKEGKVAVYLDRSTTPHSSTYVRLIAALAAALGAGVAIPSGVALAEPVTVAPVVLPTFADLAEKVSPAVVSVRVRLAAAQNAAQTTPPGGGTGPGPIPPQGQRGGTALGSGFFISSDGYVVTNNHVVENALTYTVILSDGTEYAAKLIGKDERTDLALLKIDDAPTFTYVRWADDPPRIGDWVVAIGNPFGLGGTVTMGIVSARGRTLSSAVYDDYIQIDAPINRGNSGGPSFNLKGEVIGINTAIYSTSGGSVGIAFDVPASTASKIIATLKDRGAVVRGWLGVQTQPVTSAIAASLKLPDTKGAMVADPQPGSPAELAGIKAGDVILAVDGKPIADTRDLALTISAGTPDTLVRVTIWRDGAAHDIPVKLGTLQEPAPVARNTGGGNPGGGNPGGGNPGGGNGNNGGGGAAPGSVRPDSTPREGTALPDLGLSLAASRDRPNGLDIFNVTPDGPADKAGLSDGDVLVAVAGNPVATAADVAAAVNLARQNGAKVVLLQIESGQNKIFVGVPLG